MPNDETSLSDKRPPHGMAVYSSSRKDVITSSTSHNYKTVEITLTSVSCDPQSEAPRLQVIGLYSQPKTSISHLLTTVKRVLQQKQLQNTPTVILGDFNIDLSVQSNQTKNLLSFFHTHNFHQLITSPTTDYETTIDHIYTNVTTETIHADVHETYFSYHKLISFCMHH
jgi:hypothetical protein